MDDLAAYYNPPIHHPYYQPPPPPPPPGAAHPPPSTVVAQPLHHHHQQYQPQFITYAPPVYPQSSQDQLRTLFVAGLPEDVKPREMYNLFREFPGYESSHLRPPTSSNNQPFCFCNFCGSTISSLGIACFECKDTLPDANFIGMVFDLEKGSTLYIDLAKSNSRTKRLRADDDRPGSEKKLKGSAAFSRDTNPGVGSVHVPGMSNSAYNTIGYSSTQSYGNTGGGTVNDATAKSNNPPCPTLFVANLGPTCSEQELIQVFSRCRGFIKLKMQSTYGAPVAFVDFQDTASSTEALGHLQGTILYSSPSGEGMRLEYAKSRMGMRSKKSR